MFFIRYTLKAIGSHGQITIIEKQVNQEEVYKMVTKAEIKDCIGHYILTNVDKDILKYEFDKLKRMEKRGI